MPAIGVAPFVLKPENGVTVQVGTDTYEAALSSVVFTPNMSVLTWNGLTPAAAFTDTTTPTWTCTIQYAQDWKTANSLAQFLDANAGTKKTMVFKPQGATTGSPVFTADVMIAPGPVGGDINTVQVGSVTMGVVGKPVKSVAP